MANLPDYVAMAKPNPMENRVSWWKSTAQSYAGVMLWFVFWQDIPTGGAKGFAGGLLSCGLGTAVMAVVVAALLCHALFYLIPGKLGLKTGLPLYIVGTSTYGVRGGFLMPGFLMGVLQFGWLAVNAYFSALLLSMALGQGMNSPTHMGIAIAWAVVAAFIGLKGIQYVAKVATFLPLVPLVILVLLAVKTAGGIGSFNADELVKQTTGDGLKVASAYNVFNIMAIYILGFFATAGAAGCDFGSGNRDNRDVQLGGLFGVFGSTVFAGVLSLLIVAGAYGAGLVPYTQNVSQTPALMEAIMGSKPVADALMILLAVAAFPSACFSSLIAANSFKTTLPKVNPFITCGLGTLGAIVLILSTYAGQAAGVFSVIGASFGPICGAIAADYLLSGCKWNGPRAGFNLPGWLSWFFGFIVGAFNFLPADCRGGLDMPCPPLLAFVVGFVLYALFAKLGMQSSTLSMENE
ncbi:MAG: cytosine permease [Planctomycetia bacterium]|nr:cytosine permease [Planctomycetia bacterium]